MGLERVRIMREESLRVRDMVRVVRVVESTKRVGWLRFGFTGSVMGSGESS